MGCYETQEWNGTERKRNGIYRNNMEYAGARRNDSGIERHGIRMRRNGQEGYQNIPERAGVTPR